MIAKKTFTLLPALPLLLFLLAACQSLTEKNQPTSFYGNWRVDGAKIAAGDKRYQQASPEKKKLIVRDWSAWGVLLSPETFTITGLGKTESCKPSITDRRGKQFEFTCGQKKGAVEITGPNTIILRRLEGLPLHLQRDKLEK